MCFMATVWGVVTALSRAAMGRHYVGDICAGMPLGILTVAFTTKVTCEAARHTEEAAQSECCLPVIFISMITQGCFSLDSMLVNAQQAQRLYELVNACFAWLRLSKGLTHLG